MIDLKRITGPVFLIYAGVIHAIGLALLLPMIVTLPSPGSMITPKGAPIAVELDRAEADRDQTSALSAPPKTLREDAALDAAPEPVAPAPEADAKPNTSGALANANPTAEPQGQQEKASTGEKPVIAAPRAKDKAKSSNANPKSVKKPVAQRSAKPSVRRSAKRDTKIAPFAGGISGLFTPGAPSKQR